MRFIKQIPNVLTISRFFAAAALIFDAVDGNASVFFAPLFILAAFTDCLDGFAAQKLNAKTVRGAILDGYADTILYGAAFFGVYFLFPAVFKRNLIALIILLLIQVLSWGFSLVKFRRITSYHTYLAKVWGVALFVSLAALFVFKSDSLLLPMLIIGCASVIEDIGITAVLPCWKSGIKNIAAAVRRRQ
jgi:CDP-diacylglycerol--glycerol-3-phosphate 3-phosphatidyltransferase